MSDPDRRPFSFLSLSYQYLFLARVDVETDSERQTPMHYAAKYNSLATMKLLIKFDGSIIQRDAQNRTVLFLAAEQGMLVSIFIKTVGNGLYSPF